MSIILPDYFKLIPVQSEVLLLKNEQKILVKLFSLEKMEVFRHLKAVLFQTLKKISKKYPRKLIFKLFLFGKSNL